MPEVHLPHLDDQEEADAPTPAATHRPRGKSFLKIALEVVLISTGVFLGLAGEQWRENAHRRELAEASLGRIRSEIQANRKAVVAVKDYHVATKKSLDAYYAADIKSRQKLDVDIQGVQPAFFEHTAWDLALATQSLANIDPDLAFDLSRIYTAQQNYAELSRGMMQAMYLKPPTEDLPGFVAAVAVFYGDVVLIEPKLLEMYDDLLPKINRTLAESPGEKRDH